MKKAANFLIILTSIILIPSVHAGQTHSGQAVKSSVQASGAASKGIAHSVAGSAQLASAVLAVPLVVAGSVGAVSAQAGEDLWKAGTSEMGGPLEISDETVTAGPSPDKAIQAQEL